MAAILSALLTLNAEGNNSESRTAALLAATMSLRESGAALSRCQLSEAGEWAQRAAGQIRDGQPATPAGADTKGLLAARAEAAAKAVRLMGTKIDQAKNKAGEHLDNSRANSADAVIQRFRAEYPQCASALAETHSAIRTRQSQAASLATEGDRLLPGNPKAALTAYRHAYDLNHEHDKILARIEQARARMPRRSYKAVKAVLWLTFVTALGTAGYVYVDRYRRTISKR